MSDGTGHAGARMVYGMLKWCGLRQQWRWKGPQSWWILDGHILEGTSEKRVHNSFPMGSRLGTKTTFTIGGGSRVRPELGRRAFRGLK